MNVMDVPLQELEYGRESFMHSGTSITFIRA
jgi:hypothetical protein